MLGPRDLVHIHQLVQEITLFRRVGEDVALQEPLRFHLEPLHVLFICLTKLNAIERFFKNLSSLIAHSSIVQVDGSVQVAVEVWDVHVVEWDVVERKDL